MIKIKSPVKYFKPSLGMRSTCISLLFGSVLLTGCSTLGLNNDEDAVEQQKDVVTPSKSKPAQPSVSASSSVRQTEPQAPASKAQDTKVAKAEAAPVVPPRSSQPASTPNFEEPKALQDMRAFSTDMIRGRYTATEQTAKVAAPSTKQSAKTAYSPPVVSESSRPPVATKTVATAAAVTATTIAAATEQPKAPANAVKTTQKQTVAAAPKAAPPHTPEQEEVTAAQVNEIIEKQPTAAGVETVALLDKPKEKQAPKVAEAVARVAAEKPTKTKTDLVTQALTGKRPAAIGIWSIEENWDGQHPGECRLSTPTIQIDQEGYATQVSFDVINGVLFVNTSTNIDISLKDVGIRFGNEAIEAFSDNHFANNAVWTGNLNNALKKHDELNLVLGGSELGKRRQQATINLNDLKQAFAWYQHCNN